MTIAGPQAGQEPPRAEATPECRSDARAAVLGDLDEILFAADMAARHFERGDIAATSYCLRRLGSHLQHASQVLRLLSSARSK